MSSKMFRMRDLRRTTKHADRAAWLHRRGWSVFAKVADAVAELGGLFVVLGGDGFVELGFEFLEFGERHGLLDLLGEFAQGIEGTLALELEGVFVDFWQGLDFVGGGLDDE